MLKYFLRLLIVLSLLGAMAASASSQEVLRCFVCGKKIKGAYIEYEGKIVCSQTCLGALLPKCATCGKPISAGKGLKGEYLKYNGKYYCSQECFEQSLPKCAVCGRPVKGGLRDEEGKYYCSQECYKKTLPRCAICGQPMESWVEIAGHRYCQQCAQLPRCLNCGLPGAENHLHDGRHICNQCLPEAVAEPAQAEQIFAQVRQEMKKQLGLYTDHKIAFLLVDAEELSRAIGGRVNNENGYYHYKGLVDKGSGKTVSAEYRIYILSHLSPARFRDVAAHELAHDINQAKYPKVSGAKNKRIVEGFAQYLSALMNKYWGQDDLNRDKLHNGDEDYILGFQKFMEMDRQGGLRAALAYMEQLNQGNPEKKEQNSQIRNSRPKTRS